ncbi:hypothetical protein RDI58_020143 [Solanum bulbocastanum]|uniref:Uncharacterized protein n=1 Tax=Solanum bulbocastanum TaxID=147425 RepID=A0AAN8TCA8_SOLBU
MNPSVSPMQSGQLSDCQMGNHIFVQDEQIGLIFSIYSFVLLESKYIFPYLPGILLFMEKKLCGIYFSNVPKTMYPHQRG